MPSSVRFELATSNDQFAAKNEEQIYRSMQNPRRAAGSVIVIQPTREFCCKDSCRCSKRSARARRSVVSAHSTVRQRCTARRSATWDRPSRFARLAPATARPPDFAARRGDGARLHRDFRISRPPRKCARWISASRHATHAGKPGQRVTGPACSSISAESTGRLRVSTRRCERERSKRRCLGGCPAGSRRSERSCSGGRG